MRYFPDLPKLHKCQYSGIVKYGSRICIKCFPFICSSKYLFCTSMFLCAFGVGIKIMQSNYDLNFCGKIICY